ncbi:heavy metal translocating P-type ATPase [Paenibacillus woosongensis]|uniref:Cd(2+)-exporting ATPase n=1 Tax=Paenibacillus woosongensis TaxID=307580 RepID=A0ABQ4MLT4_9BACL|nr:cation-translocating P-type ATPase [Paenibacillus woosongensis]GIP56961.1 haloacid dehalogenase [Paenibacillus woosongensis]
MQPHKLKQNHRIIGASILVTVSFILNKTLGYTWLTIMVMAASTLIAGIPIFVNAVRAIRYWIVGIDALVTIAVIGAWFIGEYWEAAAVTYLFMIGNYLESRTIERTKSAIQALLKLAPDTATVSRSGKEITINPEEVLPGELVIVKPGEKISIDGTIVEGSAYINQSAITGESLSVHKAASDTVYSGTIIESGYLLIRADKVGEDTTFAKILELVEEAQDKKARTQKFLEKFSRYYTPLVILLAVVLFAVTRDIVMALTLLVIACPGALVISAPVSIVAGIGNGARQGVLFKGGEMLEKFSSVKMVAFDKTGTLTRGKPEVTRILTYGMPKEELLKIVAVGEAYSEHPLARAILSYADKELGRFDEKPTEVSYIPGQGISFIFEDKLVLIGNRKLLASRNIQLDVCESDLAEEELLGQTTVIIGHKQRVLGMISIADPVRKEAKQVIQRLKSSGIQRVVMLTGDNPRAAKAISDQLGIDEAYSELLPQDKVRILKELQNKYGSVAMVGDGVNDAPALAAADLGIAIGGTGSDIAMETGDVVLLSGNVSGLAYGLDLSRATVRNMKQNISFAILVAILLLGGVLVKSVNLSYGMLIHEVSVLLVVLNAIRLRGFNTSLEEIK